MGRPRKEALRFDPPTEPNNETLRRAWILGVFSGAGHVYDRALSLESRQIKFLMQLCEGLKATLPDISVKISHLRKKNNYELRVNDVSLARYLGDLSILKWAETICERHSWIFDVPIFATAFLSGYFDSNGHLTSHPGISFSVHTAEAEQFIHRLLTRIGISPPKIKAEPKQNVRGVRVISQAQQTQLVDTLLELPPQVSYKKPLLQIHVRLMEPMTSSFWLGFRTQIPKAERVMLAVKLEELTPKVKLANNILQQLLNLLERRPVDAELENIYLDLSDALIHLLAVQKVTDIDSRLQSMQEQIQEYKKYMLRSSIHRTPR